MTRVDAKDKEIAAGIRFLKKKDQKLGAVIREFGPLNYKPQRSGFEALVRTITGQQLSGKAAATIYNRVRAATPKNRITLVGLHQVSDRKLRAAGLSAAKTRAFRDLIDKVDSGQLRFRRFPYMTDEQVAESIMQVKGLGPWSAQMYLMFVLRHLDVFSAGDLGIRNAIVRLYRVNPETADFEAFAERWRPYRTIACWYLWASLNNRPIKG